MVHGDDFVGVGSKQGLDKMEAPLTSKYEVKTNRLGWKKGMCRQARLLGRVVTLHEGGIDVEPDPALIEDALITMGLNGGKGVATPAVHRDFFEKVSSEEFIRMRVKGEECDKKDDPLGSAHGVDGRGGSTNGYIETEIAYKGNEEEERLLDDEAARRYLSVAALLNYISPDKPAVQYAVKECLRKSSCPSYADEVRLKRICRFLQWRQREVIRIHWQPRVKHITIFADSDFAGCPRTRKSTAGGVAMSGGHLLKSWSKTIPVLALSTGEAELMSLVRACTEALGLQALYKDLNVDVEIRVYSDATAAIGIVSRLGLGRVRRLAVSDLWVQEKARSGAIKFAKIEGTKNPSDAFTKAVDKETLAKHVEAIGIIGLSGGAEVAPRAKANESSAPDSH